MTARVLPLAESWQKNTEPINSGSVIHFSAKVSRLMQSFLLLFEFFVCFNVQFGRRFPAIITIHRTFHQFAPC